MNYRIGLSLGISSVGWAVIEENKENSPSKIVDFGVHSFNISENPKDGFSMARIRTEKRTSRRRLRRKKHRIERVKLLLEKYKLITKEELNNLYTDNNYNIYELRLKALEEELNNIELCQVLLAMVKKRGYKSSIKISEEIQNEDGKIVLAAKKNELLMSNAKYKTVAEMYLRDDKFKINLPDGSVVNKIKNTTKSYSSIVFRDMLLNEIKLILQSQSVYNVLITSDFITEYIGIFTSQRAFGEGPGVQSKYSGNIIEKCYGYCNLEPNETRAPKASYSYEYYQLLKFINKIKIEKYTTIGDKLEISSRRLMPNEIIKITELMKLKPVIDFTDIRTELNLAPHERFNLISYVSIFEYDEVINRLAEKKKQVKELENYHRIKKVLSKQTGVFESLSFHDINIISHILTVYKDNETRIKQFKKNNVNIPEHLLEELLQISFREIGDISIQALDKLIPYLENGINYKQAIKEVYHNNFQSKNLNKMIFSPISRRTISQTIKLIKAIINKYGLPKEIIFRTSKELTQKHSVRDKNKKYNVKKKIYNNKIKEELLILDVLNPTTFDFIKYELWKQQNGICMYSGETIPATTLFTDKTSIDYIIPFKYTMDESIDNKILVMTKEKQNKNNKTAYEYIIETNTEFEKYKARINNITNWKKKRNLLQRTINIENTEFEDFHFINLYLHNYLTSEFKNIQIKTVNNAILHYVKHQLNLSDLSRSAKYSVNAIITALITKIDEINDITSLTTTHQIKDLALSEIKILVLFKGKQIEGKKILINSCKPTRKTSGKAHDETLRSKKIKQKLIKAYSKTELKKLKLDKMGEIDGYPEEFQKNDPLLYNSLKTRLKEYNGNASKAFEEKFYKPKLDGSKGSLVKKVKLEQKMTMPIELKNNAIAINGDMIRIDVFKKEEGFYYIPIYVSDTVKKKLPTKACVSKKSVLDWKEMNEKDFIFSFYPNDLIYLESNNAIKLHCKDTNTSIEHNKLLVYFNSADISGATIGITSTDNSYAAKGIGIKSLIEIKKYEVDILGNYYEVKRENRRKRV